MKSYFNLVRSTGLASAARIALRVQRLQLSLVQHGLVLKRPGDTSGLDPNLQCKRLKLHYQKDKKKGAQSYHFDALVPINESDSSMSEDEKKKLELLPGKETPRPPEDAGAANCSESLEWLETLTEDDTCTSS
eukprot:g77860.t1